MDKHQFRLVKSTSTARYLPNFILAPIMAVVFVIAGSIAGLIPIKLLAGFFKNPSLSMTFFLISTYSFVILLTFLWIKLVEKRPFKSIGFFSDDFIMAYLKGFVIGVFLFSATMLVLFASGQAGLSTHPKTTVGIAAIPSILILLIGWIVQGAGEEIVTRGWLMNVLSARYNLPLGVILSSTLFGLMHLLNDHVSFLAILNIILVGFFFSLYALKTDNLWGVCGVHTSWNWAQGNLYGLEVSGNSIRGGSLFQTDLLGSDLFTGGAFGPEAGLAATIILVLAIGWLAYGFLKGR